MHKGINTKREREKAVVSEMIALYCRRQHGRKNGLCPECTALNTYARQRSDKCPFMETKTFCSNCKVHCYKNANQEIGVEMREEIRTVMRFSGPRMIKKILYVVLGCIGVALGALGAVLPLLPAFPFLLLAAFCFARSSERLNRWFTGTKLYKNNLESYVKGKGMTRKTKVKIMVTVTLLMSVGFVMMDQVPVGRIVLACVWVFHIFYFMLGVKTIKAGEVFVKPEAECDGN